MTKTSGLLLFLLLCGVIQQLILAAKDDQQLDLNTLKYTEKYLRLAENIQRDPILRAEWERNRLRQAQRDIEIPPAEFLCDVTDKSETPPTSVNELRPSDINVIAALGDSISAGNGLGANTLIEVAVPNRGEVWSIGGDRSLEEGVVTLPNIMRKFNPLLKGYSSCVSSDSERQTFRSWFNVARPGDTNHDMLEQARILVNRMINDTKVNYTHDWKLVTLFVGGNDLCGSCGANGNHNPDQFYSNFERAIQYFSDHMPRTVVNLVSMFDVTPLQNMTTGLACDLLQWGFCDCARNWTTLPALRDRQLNYSAKLELLANDARFHREDFTVIHQPHMRDMIPPIDPLTGKYVIGFLSPDCFHPTRITHQAMAAWLWNGLLTPVQHKSTTVDTSITAVPLICPDKERPYIFTRGNSEGASWPPPTRPPIVSGAPGLKGNLQGVVVYSSIMIGFLTRYLLSSFDTNQVAAV